MRWFFSVVFISVWVDNEEAKKEESIQQHTREKKISYEWEYICRQMKMILLRSSFVYL